MSRKKETGSAAVAAKTLKKGKKKASKTREQNRFRFQNFKQQLAQVSVESIRRTGGWRGLTPPEETASWFEEALEEWRELNCTAHFSRFCAQVRSVIGGGLPQIVFHQAELKKALLEHLAVEGSLAVKPLAALTAMLARDLSSDFGVETYAEFVRVFVGVLNVSENVDDIEAILRTVFYVARVLERSLVGDLVQTFVGLFKPLLGMKLKQHVSLMIVELWAVFGRKILLKDGIMEVMTLVKSPLVPSMLAAACFDGKEPSKLMPKHLKAVNMWLVQNKSYGILTKTLVQVLNIDSSDSISALLADSLPSIEDADVRLSIAEELSGCCESTEILSVLIGIVPVGGDHEIRSVETVCKLLTRSTMNLSQVLQLRPTLLALFSQSSAACVHAVGMLLRAGEAEIITPIVSASALERFLLQAFDQDPVKAMQVLKLCVKSRNAQLPQKIPFAYDTIIDASMDMAAVCLALELSDSDISPKRLISVAERLGDASMLRLLESWRANPGEGLADLVGMVSTWNGHVTVLNVLKMIPIESLGEELKLTILEAGRRHLLSGSSAIRGAALQLLHQMGYAPGSIDLCLKLEFESTWTFSCDREKGIHLSALSHHLQNIGSEDAELVIRHLLGIVVGAFRPIQPETSRVLGIYAQKYGALFRTCYVDLVGLMGQQLPEDMFGPFAWASLMASFIARPATLDYVQSDLIRLLLSLFSPSDDEINISDGFRKQVETALAPSLHALSCLKNLHKNDLSPALSTLLLSRFLPLGDSTVQKRALAAYLALSESGSGAEISFWRDNLEGILGTEQEMRERLVELAASGSVLPESVVGLMVRILYGRMVAKKGTGAGRNSLTVRRRLILHYVATWSRPAISRLISFLASTITHAPPPSAKKQLGFLSLMEAVIKKLGRFIPPAEFAQITDLLMQMATSSGDGDGEKGVRRLAMQRIVQMWAVLLQAGSTPDPVLEDVLLQRQATLWTQIVYPKVQKLASEYGQGSSGLLDLLSLWSANRPALMLDASPALATALGSIAKVKSAVALQIVSIFEGLLLHDPTLLVPFLGLLLPAIESRLAAFLASDDVKGATRLVNLLVSVAPLVTTCNDVDALTCILLSDVLGKRQFARAEHLHVSVLRVLANLIPACQNLDAADAYTKVSRWFGLPSLRSRAARESLCAVFTATCARTANPRLTRLASALADLNAYEQGQLDDTADWERQAAGFSYLRAAAREVDPVANGDWWLPILASSMHALRDEDAEIGARNQATSLLESFMEHESLDSDRDAFNTLILGQLYTGICGGLKGARATTPGGDAVRTGLLSFLGKLIARFPAQPPFAPLVPLLAGGDEEADVLQNLGHIQIHRRTRAARRLGDFAEGTGMERKVIEEIFLPFLRPVAVPPAETVPADAFLQTEAIRTVAILISKLPPKSILARTGMMLKRLKAVIEAAAGPASTSSSSSSKLPHEARALLRLVPAITTHSLGKLEDDLSTERLLAMLFEAALGPQKAGLPLAESIGVVLAARSDGVRRRHLPKLMAHLCMGLKHKEQAGRDSARLSLSRLCTALGPAYLAYALTELEATLQPASHAKARSARGSSLIGSQALYTHVHGYTVAKMMTEMDLALGDLSDHLHTIIVEVCLQHGLGPLAMEKATGSTGASGQQWTGRPVEAREQLSYTLLAKIIKCSTESQLVTLIQSISLALSDDDEPSQIQALFSSLDASLLDRFRSMPDSLRQHMVLLHAMASQSLPKDLPALNGHRPALSSLRILTGLCKTDALAPALTPLLDGFVPVLVSRWIASSKHAAVTCAAIQCLNGILANWNPAAVLPSLEPLVPTLVGRLFELLVKTDAKREQELSASTLRLIATVVRQVPGVTLTDSQTRALLAYTREHLDAHLSSTSASSTSSSSTLAFTLVRTLLSKRVMLPEVPELMSTIARAMVISPDASLRSQCRAAYASFLLDYPLGPQKIQEQLATAAKDMASFEWDTGRLSSAQLLASLLPKLPADILKDWSSALLLRLASRVAAEPSETTRKGLVELAAALATRLISDAQLADCLKEATLLIQKWMALKDKPAVMRAAWILAKPFSPADSAAITKEAMSVLSAPDNYDSAILEAVLNVLADLPLDKLLSRLLADEEDALLMVPSIAVRDKINSILLSTPPSSLSFPLRWAERWSVNLMELPAETEQPVIDRLVKCLIRAWSPECAIHLERIEKALRPILGDPARITKERATITAALRLSAGLLLSHASSIEQKIVEEDSPVAWIKPLTALSIRIATCDHLQATQASIVERALAETLRSSANDILEMLQAALGSESYTDLTQNVVQAANRSRSTRKSALAHLAVNDPEAYARRKLARNATKKDQRKRKVDRTREKANKRQRT